MTAMPNTPQYSQTPPPELPAQTAEPAQTIPNAQTEQEKQMRRTITGIIIGAIVMVILLCFTVYYLLQPGVPTDKIRDVFIIVVALESLVIGVALVVLIVQLASLINLLQNEVRPILKATNDTVNNLRGTAEFLGENVVEPVIKLNGYLAGLYRTLELMGIKKK
jgi:amino acid permease